jgi:hypothetical protein
MLIPIGTRLTNKNFIRRSDSNKRIRNAIYIGIKPFSSLFKFPVYVCIEFKGIKGKEDYRKASEFFKKNTIFFSAGIYPDTYRVLLNSLSYDKCTLPKFNFERTGLTNKAYNKLNSNKDGYICVYLPTPGWFSHFNEDLENICKILENIERKIVFKLHPRCQSGPEEKKAQILKIIEQNGYSVVTKVDESDLFAAIVPGGRVVFELVEYGIPVFCFDKYKKEYLCASITSDDISLLKSDEITYFPNFEKTLDFYKFLHSHTVHKSDIKNGNVFREIACQYPKALNTSIYE